MQDYIDEIVDMPLFSRIQRDKLPTMLQCLGASPRSYRKGSYITLARDSIQYVGVVLDGGVQMIKEDIWGDKTILVFMKRGELFGETFSCGSMMGATVSFYSAENTRVLFLPFYKMINSCTMACEFHHRLIENMVRLIAAKNVQLMEKVEITAKKTLRKKILTYLSFQSDRAGSRSFTLPISRTELAEYICADRTALARELTHMKEEGIIDFHHNDFKIL